MSVNKWSSTGIAKTTGVAVIALVMLGLLSACGAEDSGGNGGGNDTEGTQSAQQPSGEIVFATLPGWIGPNEVRDFEKKYPDVSVSVVPEDSTTGAPQVLAQDLDAYDIALLDTISAPQMWDAGQLEELNISQIPNYQNIGEPFRDDLPPACIPTDYGKVGIIYNSDIVKEPVDGWGTFFELAPEYSGQFTLTSDGRGSLITALLKEGFDPNSEDQEELEAAKAALEEIKPHLQALKNLDTYKGLLDGSIAMSYGYDFEAAKAHDENPAIKWVSPSEGVLGYSDGICAIKGANMAAVEAFLNFHLQPEVAAEFTNATSTPYTVPAVAPYLKSELEYMKDNEILTPATDPFALATLSPEATKLYNLIWNEVLNS